MTSLNINVDIDKLNGRIKIENDELRLIIGKYRDIDHIIISFYDNINGNRIFHSREKFLEIENNYEKLQKDFEDLTKKYRIACECIKVCTD